MRRIILASTVLVLLIVAALGTAPSTTACTGCTLEQRQQCADEADRQLQQCVAQYGEAFHWYCEEQASDYWDTCLAVKGCPVLPHNP